MFALSSLSPLYISLWTITFNVIGFKKSLIWLFLFIFSIIYSKIIIEFSEKKLEILYVKFDSIENIENVAFWVTIFYLLSPFLVYYFYGYIATVIMGVVIFVFVFKTEFYYCNPTAWFIWGYIPYILELDTDDGRHKVYILISKSIARKVDVNVYKKWGVKNMGDIKAVQIFDGMLIELEEGRYYEKN